jgi:hypothetical protein
MLCIYRVSSIRSYNSHVNNLWAPGLSLKSISHIGPEGRPWCKSSHEVNLMEGMVGGFIQADLKVREAFLEGTMPGHRNSIRHVGVVLDGVML